MSTRVVIAGWGQVKQGKHPAGPVSGPLGLMTAAARRAAETAGSHRILAALDAVMVVRVMSHPIRSAAGRLSVRIGATPRYQHVSGIGGNSPQQLVNRAAGMIRRGELESVLIAGAEAYYPRNRDDAVGDTAIFKGFLGESRREDMNGVAEIDARHGITLPVHGFPLYETALWAESGLELEAYHRRVGHAWRQFSQTAAAHPYAWLRQPRSVRDIVRAGDANRMVAFPYTKFMTSMIFVDLGAALILMSEAKARQWKRAVGETVYVVAGASSVDTQPYPSQKSSFTASTSLKTAAGKALARSGFGLEAVDAFDLYSCFPASVAIARRMLGIGDDDPRPMTLTGGLGFFGGPGNNYSLHAIATLAEAIAQGRFATGMVTSLGWFMAKHAMGVYSRRPPETDNSGHDLEDEAAPPVGPPPEKVAAQASGTGHVETYTVLFDRGGMPERAVLYGKMENGRRFVALAPHATDVYAALTTRCQVGAKVRLCHRRHENLNRTDWV